MQQTVLNFWFKEVKPSQWWVKDIGFDQLIKEKFGELHQRAVNCELYEWRQSANGRLAEIVVLDQFSRNIFRNTPLSFSNDSLALALSQEAIANKSDQQLSPIENNFLYMPFMHSESLAIHNVARRLYEKNGIESSYEFELKHRAIIKKFGRYPHRNSILKRASSTEETEFLTSPGSSF